MNQVYFGEPYFGELYFGELVSSEIGVFFGERGYLGELGDVAGVGLAAIGNQVPTRHQRNMGEPPAVRNRELLNPGLRGDHPQRAHRSSRQSQDSVTGRHLPQAHLNRHLAGLDHQARTER